MATAKKDKTDSTAEVKALQANKGFGRCDETERDQ